MKYLKIHRAPVRKLVILKKLIEPQPEGFVPETYYGYVNPYTYAGGKIKATE